MPVSPPFSLAHFQPGDHACQFYETEAERRAVLTPFLRRGLEAKQKVIYLAEARAAEAAQAGLRADGMETAPYLERGQLSLVTETEAFTRADRFDPADLIAFLQTETDQALADGYTALRVTGEMAWVWHSLSDAGQLLEHETRLNTFFTRHLCLALCQYDRRQFSARQLLDVLQNHPLAVVGAEVCENFYYIPAEEVLPGAAPEETRVRHWLKELAGRRQAKESEQAQELAYRHVLDGLPDCLAVISLEGAPRFIDSNRANCRMLGYSREELTQYGPQDLDAPEHAAQVKGFIKQLLRDGQISFETVHVSRSGRRIPSEVNASLIDYGGKPAILSISRDITTRKQAENAARKLHAELETEVSARATQLETTHQALEDEIVRRRLSEASRHENEERYRTLVEASPDAIALINLDGHFLLINEQGAHLLGYESSGELLGQDAFQYAAPEDRPRLRRTVWEIRATGQIRREEFTLLGKDGRRFPAEVSGVLIHTHAGQPLAFHCMMRDITERKQAEAALRQARDELEQRVTERTAELAQSNKTLRDEIAERRRAEEALRESEARFRLLLQHVPAVAVQGYRMDGTTHYWNDASTRLYGYTAEEATGKNLVDLIIPPEIRPEVKKAMAHMAETGQPIPAAELSLMRKDGSRVAVFSSHAVVTRPGQPPELFCIDVDLTERKQAEEKLQESERQYRELFTNACLAIFQTTLDGKVLAVNPEFARLFGFAAPEEVAATVKDAAQLFADPQRREEIIRLKAENPDLTTFENLYRRKDGGVFWGKLTVRQVVEAKNRAPFFEGFIEDITERKRAEAALQTKEEAQRFFSKRLTGVLEAINELSRIEPFDTLCRRSVELAIERLGFDRVGLCFLSADQRTVLGVYGTDETGHLRDEKHLQRPTLRTPTVKQLLESPELVLFFENEVLYNNKLDPVGIGDHAIARLWNGEKIIGIYAVDNLLHQNPITAEDLKILGLYGTAMGHLFTLKRAEETLRQSEALIRNISDNLILGMLYQVMRLPDGTRKFTYLSDAVQRLYGITPQEGMANADLIYGRVYPDDRTRVFQAEEEANQTPSVFKCEARMINPDGGIRWSYFVSNPRQLDDGTTCWDGIEFDITERKQTDNEFHRSETMLKEAQQLAHLGHWYWNITAGRLTWSDEIFRIFGVDPQTFAVTAENFEKAIHPDDLAPFLKAREQMLAQETDADLGHRIVRPDGAVRYVLERARVLRDSAGNAIHVVGTVQDITERKQAEAVLREGEERYRLMFESAPLAINITRGTDIIYANPSYLAMFGYSSLDELKHLQPVELFAPEWRPKIVENIQRRAKGLPVPNHYEAACLRRDGTELPVIMYFTRAMFADGPATVGFLVDITDRKQAENALRESEARYRTMLGAITSYVYTVKMKDGRQVSTTHSPGCAAVTGYTPAEYAADPSLWYNMIYPEDQDHVVREIERILDSDFIQPNPAATPPQLEHRIYHKDGSLRWIRVTLVAHQDSAGKLAAYDGLIEDITERKQAEEALQTSEAMLSSALKMARLGHWEYNVASDQFTFSDHFYALFRTTAEREGGYTMASAQYAQRFVHPDDQAAVGTEIQQALETTDPLYSRQLEHRMIYADGEVGYIAVRFFILKNAQGRTVKTYGVNQDITERKRAEAALKESEEKFAKAFQTIPEAVTIAALEDGKYLDVNEAFLHKTGFQRAEVIGHTSTALNVWVDPEDRKRYLAELTAHNRLRDFAIPYRMRSGEIRDFLVSGEIVDIAGKRYSLNFILDITERKRAEEKQRTSEERWRLSIENMLEAYALHEAIYDENGRMVDYRFLEFNPTAQKLSNIARADIVGHTALELYPHVAERGLLGRYADVMATGRPAYIQDFYYAGDRLDKAFDISCFRIDDRHFVCVFRDITARQQAEEALRRERDLMDRIMLTSPVAITMLDRQGQITFANPRAEQVLGLTKNQITQRSYNAPDWRITDFEGRPFPDDALPFQRVQATRQPVYGIEHAIQWPDGRRVLLSINAAPLFNATGEWAGMVAALEDVTERKQAEAALRESEEKLRLFIEHAPAALAMFDRDMRYIAVSRRWVSDFHLQESDFIGRSHYESFPEIPDQLKAIHRRGMNGEVVKGDNDKFERADGSVQWLCWEMWPWEAVDGSVGGIVIFSEDVTERKQAEQKLARRVTELSHQLTALYDVLAVAGQEPTASTLLEQALGKVLEAGGGTAAGIHLWDKNESLWQLQAHQGLPPDAQAALQTLTSSQLSRDEQILVTGGAGEAPICVPDYPAGLTAPIVLRGNVIGALSVFWDAPRTFTVENLALFGALAEQLAIIMENIRLRRQSREMAVLEERQRLARDLHDSVAQALYGLVLQASAAPRMLQAGQLQNLTDSLTALREGALRALKEMRLLVYELRPSIPLEQAGLEGAVQARLEAVEKHAQVSVSLRKSGPPAAWDYVDGSPAVLSDLYLIVTEALNNALKHAATETLTVRLLADERHILAEVADDGNGFDLEKAVQAGGAGLSNMRERARRLGGELTIRSTPGAGATVSMQMPWPGI